MSNFANLAGFFNLAKYERKMLILRNVDFAITIAFLCILGPEARNKMEAKMHEISRRKVKQTRTLVDLQWMETGMNQFVYIFKKMFIKLVCHVFGLNYI